MASTDARPFPQKNVAFRVTFPILNNTGSLVTGAAGLDSEVSKDGGTFADCTSEATEIATASGIYYLDLTATEMNADTVAIIVKTTTTDAKTTVLVMYPEEAGDVRVNVTAYGGTAGTFAAGRPEVNTTHAAGTAWNSGAIVAATLATDTITAAKIAADAITATQIAAGAIDAATFAAGAINAAAIAADAITAAKVADGTIDAATFAAGAINAAAIADGAIDALTFAAGAINAAAIATDAITAAKIADGALDAGAFAADSLTAAKIASDVGTEFANALLDLSAGVDTGLTVRQFYRLAAAVLVGKASGLAGTTATYRNTGDTVDRVVATVDASGNRTAVTLTP